MIMSQQELNSERCEFLRGEDFRIRNQISQFGQQMPETTRTIESREHEIQRLESELESLRATQLALLGGSLLRGMTGIVGGLTEGGVSAKIAILEAQIDQFRGEIHSWRADRTFWSQQIDELESQLAGNANQMHSLSCVLP